MGVLSLNTNELLIQKIILEMDKPFLLSELFDVIMEKGINNKELVLHVLDQLLNSGLVEYSDFEDDLAMYHSKFAIIT